MLTSSGKHIEEISHAQIVCLMYKMITSARDTDDLSIGFDRDRGRRQREFNNTKNLNGKYHVRIYIEDFSWICWTPKRATLGLGYQLVLTRNSDNALLNKANATVIGKN